MRRRCSARRRRDAGADRRRRRPRSCTAPSPRPARSATLRASWPPPERLRDELADLRRVPATRRSPSTSCSTSSRRSASTLCVSERRADRHVLVGRSGAVRPRACRPPAAACFVQVRDRRGRARRGGAGADALIAQGIEAGGHVEVDDAAARRWSRRLRRATRLPVVAAGGIADAATAPRRARRRRRRRRRRHALRGRRGGRRRAVWKDALVARRRGRHRADGRLRRRLARRAAPRAAQLDAPRVGGGRVARAPGARPGEGEVVA